jgi:4-amino-4-deoxy-L-arabinose transferase-like glycosyltransferase
MLLSEGPAGRVRGRPVFATRAERRGVSGWLGCALLLLAGAFVLFSELGKQPLVAWDEARNAVNAIEMTDSGDFVVARYDGEPDLWNVKPPLLIWAQALSLELVEDVELAVRLPAALAALATLLLVYWFAAIELGEPLAGVVAGLVLLGTPAFVGYHAARNGDYDALLTLWTTLYAIAWFRYLADGRARDLALFSAGLGLAMLTKGIAGGLMGPGLLLLTALDGKLRATVADRRAWAALGAALAVPAVWYGMREAVSPGYLAAVFHFELGQYFVTVDGHAGGTFYYVTNWLERRFWPWSALLPVAILLAWRERARAVRWAICAAAGFLLVIDASGTKLPWYDLPAYPPAALLLGLGAASAALPLLRRLSPTWAAAACIVAGAALMLPVLGARETVLAQAWESDPRLGYGAAIASMPGPRVLVLDGGVENAANFENYNPVLQFHADLARERGVEVDVVNPGHRFRPGDDFLTCDPEALEKAARSVGVVVRRTLGRCAVATVKTIEARE